MHTLLCLVIKLCVFLYNVVANVWFSGDKSDEKSVKETETRVQTSATGRRGSLQLWQFLVALLDAPDASAGCIAWTGRGMEFKLIEPEEVS